MYKLQDSKHLQLVFTATLLTICLCIGVFASCSPKSVKTETHKSAESTTTEAPESVWSAATETPESPELAATQSPESRYAGKTIVSAEVIPEGMAFTADYPYASPRVGIGGSGTIMSIFENGYTNPRMLEELKKQNAAPEVIKMAETLQDPDFENNVIFYVGISAWEKGNAEEPLSDEILTREIKRLQGLGYDVELADDGICGYLTKDQIFSFPTSEVDEGLEYLIGLEPLYDKG